MLARADGGGLSVAVALEELLDAQLELRIRRRLESARRTSRLPHLKTLADFDFSLQPSVERSQLESLHEPGFLRRHENVVFCGPPGVGKTHLATSLGVAAITAGRSVYFTTLPEVVESMRQAQENGTFKRRLGLLLRAALLIVDEIGYLSLSEDGGRLFFQLVRAASRAWVDGADDQQGLRGMGRGTGRRGDGDGDAGSSAASVPRGEHPGHELPHAGVPGDASDLEPDRRR